MDNSISREEILKLYTEPNKGRKGDYYGQTPPVRFRILKCKKTGKLFYRRYHIIDNRWFKRPWQKEVWSGGNLDGVKSALKAVAVFIQVMVLPRRHGKTWWMAHTMIDLLWHLPHNYARAAFYCLLKSQAFRNAKEAIYHAVQNTPGAIFDETDAILKIPRPTLKNPSNFLEFGLRGVRGGEDIQRGDREDIAAADEVDGFTRSFINKVIIVPATDHDGIVFLGGTKFGKQGKGVLDFYLNKSKYIQNIQNRMAKNEWHGPVPKDVNNWGYYEKESMEAGVFSKDKLDILKAIMGEEDFGKEFQNKVDYAEFFYRQLMDAPQFMETHLNPHVLPDPGLPFHVYYDLGIGDKRDKMAFCFVQHTLGTMNVFWSVDIPNSTLKDPIIQIKTMNPFPQIPIEEHVLPHDAHKRDSDHFTEKTKFETYLKEYGVAGSVRVMEKPSSKTLVITLGAEVLQKSVFNSQYAFSTWDALYHYIRKQIMEGVYSDDPAKTKYRDIVDAFLLAARDHLSEDYKLVGINKPSIREAREPGQAIRHIDIVDDARNTGGGETFNFSGF